MTHKSGIGYFLTFIFCCFVSSLSEFFGELAEGVGSFESPTEQRGKGDEGKARREDEIKTDSFATSQPTANQPSSTSSNYLEGNNLPAAPLPEASNSPLSMETFDHKSV